MRRAISSAMRRVTMWRLHPFSGEGLSTRIPRQSTWSEGYGSQALAASSSLPHGDGEVSGFHGPLFRGESQLIRSKAEKTLRFAVISRRNYRVFMKLILNLFARVPITLSSRFYSVPSPRINLESTRNKSFLESFYRWLWFILSMQTMITLIAIPCVFWMGIFSPLRWW